MKINKKIYRLIADLEYLVGKECYNANAYDGYRDVQGMSFRYPVSLPTTTEEEKELYGEYKKCRTNIKHWRYSEKEFDGSFQNIRLAFYQFGSNELCIGQGIVNILEFLEARYGLDFMEMEKKIK